MVKSVWNVVKKRVNYAKNPKKPRSPLLRRVLHTNKGTVELSKLLNRYVTLLLNGGNVHKLENAFRANYKNLKNRNTAERSAHESMMRTARAARKTPGKPPLNTRRRTPGPSPGSALRLRSL